MRPIDADALMCDIGETVLFSGKPDIVSAELRGARKVVDRIEAAPTVDAVEVVRCGECKYMQRMIGTCYCKVWAGFNGYGDDGYCSYGEKR